MNLHDKNVLVLGLGITGISTINALFKLGANILISDTKNEEALKDILEKIKNIPLEKYLDNADIDLKKVDLVIKSPGIPPNVKIVREAQAQNIEIITDIELAYRISPTKNIIAITGTNGKTTSTILTGEIFKAAKHNTNVVGNIGVGILDKMLEANKHDVFVIEASSFQLEHTSTFKPKVSLITNITPDHIDWHGNFENYIESKLKVAANQDMEDHIVLNYDDLILRKNKDRFKGSIIWYSIKEVLEKGVYIDNECIIISDGQKKTNLMSIRDLKVIGKHNLENICGCIGIALAFKIELDIIKSVLLSFHGVEHRIEFVAEKRGIKFYNDSKGTNSNASIKAIEAVNKPIILIAGGYDKGSTYDDLIQAFNNKVKALILLGDTKEKIRDAAINKGFDRIYLVDDMKEAVKISYKIGEDLDNVLLSPACASWGMYRNYEERGNDFKNEIFSLME